MTDRDKIISKIANRLIRERQENFTWDELIAAISDADQFNKIKILNAARKKDIEKLSSFLLRLIDDKLVDDARNEAEDMMEDDSIDLKDMKKIFRR